MVTKIKSPNNKKLADKIEFFYQYSNLSGKRAYFTYPNNHCFWTIAINAKKTIEENIVYLEEDKNGGVHQTFVGPITKRFKVIYSGNVNVISICFKPLHIHSFLSQRINLQDHKMIFDIPKDSLLPKDLILNELENTGTDIFLQIERYLYAKMNSFSKPKIERAIQLIESDLECKIEDITQEVNLSLKSLISNFKKYIGRTPLEYKRVHKFRLALSNEKNSLTQQCYDSKYFDQSHMIKEFQRFGKQSPSKINKRKNVSGINDIFWLEA